MLGASVSFILSDTFVKLANEELSVAQIIIVRSLIAAPVVALIAWRQGAFSNLRLLPERFIALRMAGELSATVLYLSALARMEIANATAIIQTVPLTATIAAFFLGERVGVRRWTAIGIGFLAVLLIVRPGLSGFNGWSLVALASVGFIALRDVASRFLPMSTHPLAVSTLSLIAMAPLGFAMLPFESWVPLTKWALICCAASGLFLSIAFVLITSAMRHGEMSVVAPFRYAIMLWAVIIQVTVFSVLPDALTLIGSAILVATGIYTLYRERKLKAAALAAAGSGL